MKDGLSGITVYSIAQDKDGFLWFGTETGLSRFDGSHFKNYTANEGLKENEIISLFVDSKNRVWIFPFKNSVYYYYHGKIYSSLNDPLLNRFRLKDEIFKACEDKNENIFFLQTNKVLILSSNNEITEIDKIDGKDFITSGCGRIANGNCILFLNFVNDTCTSSYEYNNSKFVFKKIRQDKNLARFSIEINADYSLIRNANFFEISNYKTKEQLKIKVPEQFHNVSYINDSCLAISTSEKTFLLNINQKNIVDSFLSYTTVNKCFKDNEDNLWFATVGHGLYRLSSTKFKIYTPSDNYISMPVYALRMDSTELYIGSTKLLLWDLQLHKNVFKKIKINTDYNIGRISAIYPSNKKSLVLGTDNGIFKLGNSHVSNYIKRISVKGLFPHNDSILTATDRYVFDFSLHNFENVNIIWQGRATCACKVGDQYYIGTLSGLYIVENNPEHSIINLGKTSPPLDKKIVAMVTATDGSLWIAAENNGIICLKKNKISYRITAENGLISDACRCLYISKNNLWVGSDKGISMINLTNPFKITNFTAAEGLDCEIINCIYAKGDSVFAGTPFGVTFFEADKIQTKSICELKLIDIQSRNDNWYYKQDSINLQRNDNSLRFEYTGISFVSSGDITYHYQLKGLDSTWQSTKQNSVEFQSLPAGNYQFNLYAINRYGIKSKMITIVFSKEKTFWQTIWVRGMLVVIVAFIIWLIFRGRMKIIKRKADEKILRERKIYELEQMALRSQMNPHFIFNSLNSLQQYVFAGDAIEANHFITNFSSLVRQTLYISGKKFITLDEEIKYLESYLTLEQAKYENIFNFQINVSENVPENILLPPLLLQPFIENSIRHGVLNLKKECGKILIQFWVDDNFLLCLLEDNGIGREHSMKLKNNAIDNHRSKGMELVQKRIENLNSIYNVNIAVSIGDVVEKNKTGTRVKIQLPLNYDHN